MSPVEGTAVLTFYLSYLASSYRTSLDIRFLLLLYTVVPNYPWSCPLYCTMCLFESFIKSNIFKYDCETLFCDLTFLRLKSRNRSVVGVYVYFFSENIDDTNSLTPTVFAECHDYIHNRQTVVHLEP